MTKVTLHYELTRPLSDEDAEAVGRAHSVYGLARVLLDPALEGITVDYDATRMTERDVEAALIRVGVPVKRVGSGLGVSGQWSVASGQFKSGE